MEIATVYDSPFRSGIHWLNGGNSLLDYDEAICVNPSLAELWNIKGLAYCNLSRYNDAVKCYDRATEMDIQFAEAWFNKGLALVNLNRYDEAIWCFCQVTQIDPSNALAWCIKALIFEELKLNSESEVALTTAADLWSSAREI